MINAVIVFAFGACLFGGGGSDDVDWWPPEPDQVCAAGIEERRAIRFYQAHEEGSMEGFELDRVDIRPKSQEGVDMELRDPAGKPTGVILIVRGTDSAAYKEKQQEHIRRQIGRAGMPSEEERNREFLELHATLIAGWKGKPLMRAGVQMAHSPENALALLDQYDWIFDQVRRFADRRANFLPGSSTA